MTAATTVDRRQGGAPLSVLLGLLCGIALPVAAAMVAVLAGLAGVAVANAFGLGGDSAVFGEGADGFVVGAFLGFAGAFGGGLVLVALAIRRSFGVPLLLPLLAVLAPSVVGLLLLGAAL
jgi:hypothetical protein